MTDFVPANGAVKHKRQEIGSLDSAFVEMKDQENPTCCAYGRKYPGDYIFCRNVTKEVQDQSMKAVEAGHFKQQRK